MSRLLQILFFILIFFLLNVFPQTDDVISARTMNQEDDSAALEQQIKIPPQPDMYASGLS